MRLHLGVDARRVRGGQVALERVVQLLQPRGVVRGGHGAGHDGTVVLVAVGEDVLGLVFLPVQEDPHHFVDVEHRVVGGLDEVPDVVALEAHVVGVTVQFLEAVAPGAHVGGALFGRGELGAAEDEVAHVPGLGVEHVEREPLVLGAQVVQAGVLLPHHAPVEAGGVDVVRRLQCQLGGQERVLVQVAGTQDHGVELAGLTVGEVHGAALEAVDQRQFLHALGPVVAHGGGPVGHGDVRGAHLVGLHADVLGGVGRADQQDALALESLGAAEVVSVADRAGEGLDPLEVRHVGEAEVAGGHDHPVELGAGGLARAQVLHGHGEGVLVAVVVHPADGGGELDFALGLGAADAAVDVVPQHLARRVGGDGAAEVLVEGVLGELQGLLGAVRPQVAVHGGVHGLAVAVRAGAPVVVPLAAPVVLLLVADDLGDLGPCALGGLERTQCGDPAGSGSDDGNTLSRHRFPSGRRAACPFLRLAPAEAVPGAINSCDPRSGASTPTPRSRLRSGTRKGLPSQARGALVERRMPSTIAKLHLRGVEVAHTRCI